LITNLSRSREIRLTVKLTQNLEVQAPTLLSGYGSPSAGAQFLQRFAAALSADNPTTPHEVFMHYTPLRISSSVTVLFRRAFIRLGFRRCQLFRLTTNLFYLESTIRKNECFQTALSANSERTDVKEAKRQVRNDTLLVATSSLSRFMFPLAQCYPWMPLSR